MGKWLSDVPRECDICHEPLVNVFIDGATIWGPWGILCERCHRLYGKGLGLGRGQKYDHNTREKLEG